jgi:predicted TIM-barrel fold metal-dependent hydrolase
MEIVDAQIHEPRPPRPLDEDYPGDLRRLVAVEMAREAMDSVGVDAALVFAGQEFMDTCIERYPERFAGVRTLDYMAEDLEQQVADLKSKHGMLGGRNFVGNSSDFTIRTEFAEGKLERLYILCEKYDLPLFFSTNGWAHVLERVAAQYPGLTIIVDHLGVAQSPISPPRPDPWDKLPGLLGLAKYPNVFVKFCGAPLLSKEPFPYVDTWPYLHKVINAFGPERLMWASDFTRMRWMPITGELAPRGQWKFYSDCLNFIRDTSEISHRDKEQILGTTIRRVLHWPK